MEDDFNILGNGRRPQYFLQMENDLNMLRNGRQPKYFLKFKIISILENGRQPQYFGKQKTTFYNSPNQTPPPPLISYC